MITTNDDDVAEKAKIIRSHGMINRDDHVMLGYNYRMNELQGAVGLAQLKKLDYVVAEQRKNAGLIREAISDLPIEMRIVPDGSFETADALVFFVDSNQTARRCRDALLEAGLGTKILPEAITWHFAGTWDHMPELVNRNGKDLLNSFPASLKLLNRSVSLPIAINMVDNFTTKIRDALTTVLK